MCVSEGLMSFKPKKHMRPDKWSKCIIMNRTEYVKIFMNVLSDKTTFTDCNKNDNVQDKMENQIVTCLQCLEGYGSISNKTFESIELVEIKVTATSIRIVISDQPWT